MKIEFGVFLSPELIPYPEIENRTKYIEDQNYHSLWLSDHLEGMYDKPSDPRLESWTTISALAAKTKRIKLSHLTLAVPFRNPALLAKMATTLDIVSGGRVILSIGAGWHQGEFNAYGYKFDSLRSRSDRLEEAAAIIKGLMTQEETSYNGKYYSTDNAYNQPPPVQIGGVPLMIAGEGEKRTLKTCAKYGDMSNYAIWRGTAGDFKRKTEVLETHCHHIDRDPNEILKTWPAFTFIDRSEERAMGYAKKFFTDGGRVGGLIGSPETLVQEIYSFMDAGAGMVILSFLGPDWKAELDLFKEEVMPEFS